MRRPCWNCDYYADDYSGGVHVFDIVFFSLLVLLVFVSILYCAYYEETCPVCHYPMSRCCCAELCPQCYHPRARCVCHSRRHHHRSKEDTETKK